MANSLYPIKLEPHGVRKPWGGQGLIEHFGRPLPRNLIEEDERKAHSSNRPPLGWGESWEVSDNHGAMTHVANGPLAGMSLHKLYRERGEELLGEAHFREHPERFPLLAKLLDAEDTLSVQVHPDDEATARPGEAPKTEAWHIIHAHEDARIWCGTRPGVTADDLRRSFYSPWPLSCLHSFRPRAGQTLFVPARTVHTLGGGVVFAEIQQNSSTTLRLHDFSGRAVDLDRGLQVVDFERGPVDPLPAPPADQPVATVLECDKFVIRRLRVDGHLTQDTSSGFQILTVLSGSGCVVWCGEEHPIAMGESILLPASLGAYTLEGRLETLQYFLPDGDVKS